MNNVIDFPSRYRGSGALEALDIALSEEADLPPEGDGGDLRLRDRLIARLWLEGFKIVPLDASDKEQEGRK